MSMPVLPPKRVNNPGDFGRVAVLMGGWSAERDISLLTGKAVLGALVSQGVDAHTVDPKDGFQRTLLAGDYDRAWIALHGRGGEDGTVQGALEYLGIAYTGSGVLGSAVSMDKLRSKQVFQAAGLGTPPFALLNRAGDIPGALQTIGLPLAMKPAREGSSIGMTRVTEAGQMKAAFELAREYDPNVLAERWIEGPEYTAGVLGDVVMPLLRIETPRDYYDYKAKYLSDSTRYHCPSGLSGEVDRLCRHQSLAAFNAVGARGWGRVDFLLSEANGPLFLEVNTVPGMTDHSLVPMAAKAIGCDFEELVWRILETSFPVETGTS